MRIVHLSDLHICRLKGRSNIRLTEMALNFALEMGFDHLVITGDMVHNPNRGDFNIARDIFQNLGILDSGKLSLTIGNHEIHGGIHTLNEAISFPGKSLRNNYVRRINEFVDYFPEAFENIYRLNDKSIFPFAKIIGDSVLIGINSVKDYSLFQNPLASNGHVSNRQISEIDCFLKLAEIRDKNKIIMMHHHFCEFTNLNTNFHPLGLRRLEWETLKLHGKARLLEFFKKHKIELVLHGHIHESAEYRKNGIFFSNAGGSVDGFNSGLISINLIDISKAGVKIEIHSFSPEAVPSWGKIYSGNPIPEFAN